MTASFASQDWAAALGSRLQESAAVRAESTGWVHGPIALVVDEEPEHGLQAATIRLDVHEGSVRSVAATAPADAAPCPFELGGSFARWKAIFGGDLSLVDGILESKLRVRGDLPTLARHRTLLDAITAAGGQLDTDWQDEQEPASASAD